jgi:Winged helix DNA-binding domain
LAAVRPRGMSAGPVELSRDQVLAYRRRVQSLDERLPQGAGSLREAAWAGLQDSMPRAAVLSIHARVAGTASDTWSDPSLTQVWGPRFSVFVVAAEDAALFTLGRYPDDARGRRVAEETAARVREYLNGRTMRDRDVAGPLGMGNGIRYATTTGTIRIRWEGALAPTMWVVPRPEIEPFEARVELARRYLHVFGPTTPSSFAHWAGIGAAQGRAAFEALAGELLPARTPIGDGWLLASDEKTARAAPAEAAPARFLPSGDPFFLSWGADRELLLPDAGRRGELWTSRVWPGALLVDGDIAGVWRRAGPHVTIDAWRRLTKAEQHAVEAEAATLPLPGLTRAIRVRWPD